MNEVHFTVGDVAQIMDISHRAVVLLCRPPKDPASEAAFPRAYLPYGSRRHGYRIPADDVLNYAQQEGQWLVDRVNRAIAERREMEPKRILQAV